MRASDAAVTGIGGRKKLCEGGGGARRLALDAEPAEPRFEPRAEPAAEDDDDAVDDASADETSGPTAGAATGTFFGAGRRLGAGVAAPPPPCPVCDEVA
jgi:hypothetical protein